jgi:hypothetical protein
VEGAAVGSVLIKLNGADVWAYVVETDEGLRVRFDIDDWQRMNLVNGQRLPIRLPGKDAAALFITNVSEQPPVVWVAMAQRIRAAGRVNEV